MLPMVEKRISGGTCQVSNSYGKTSNKYMKENHDENEEPSYIQYYDANSLYSCEMSQKLPVDGFKRKKNVCVEIQ